MENINVHSAINYATGLFYKQPFTNSQEVVIFLYC